MKSIREIALTQYYPYGRNKEKIIAKRIFEVDEALNKHEEYIRADEVNKFVEWCYINGIRFDFNGHLNEEGKSDVPERIDSIIKHYKIDSIIK